MAINNAAINSVYNYYLTSYAPKTDTKFDAHKKSELRGVYNSIVKMNSESPLFIVDRSQETREYAVGLKENARTFRNTIASLGGLEDSELLSKKVAASSNEEIATVSYIGENKTDGEGLSFDLEVLKLATSQTNEGRMLPSDRISLPRDTYSFDIGINGLNYEFQYNVAEGDSNRSIQDKLARLITNADIGLKARVSSDGNGNSALVIESDATGHNPNGRIFSITDNNTSKTSGSVSYFGLNNTTIEASNAEFLINGNERQASANMFTVDKQYEITLNRANNDGEAPVQIGLKADLESMVSNINKLIGGFNSFVETTETYEEGHPKSGQLVHEMQAIAMTYKTELSNVGISVADNGRLELDEGELRKSVSGSDEDMSSGFGGLRKFAGAVLRKANQVSLDPMQYADKTIVSYKNPGHNYVTPYVTSAYSGMLFNGYC